MARYVFWDKTSDIYTPGRDRETGKMVWTAQEYINNKAAWAGIPTVKVVVSGGAINGAVFMEFEAMKQSYISAGLVIPEGKTDEEILALIEEFEDNPPINETPSAEERTAAALEAIADGQTTENKNALDILLGEE